MWEWDTLQPPSLSHLNSLGLVSQCLQECMVPAQLCLSPFLPYKHRACLLISPLVPGVFFGVATVWWSGTDPGLELRTRSGEPLCCAAGSFLPVPSPFCSHVGEGPPGIPKLLVTLRTWTVASPCLPGHLICFSGSFSPCCSPLSPGRAAKGGSDCPEASRLGWAGLPP